MRFILKSTCQQAGGKIATTTFCFNNEQNPRYIDIVEFESVSEAKTRLCNFVGMSFNELFFNEDNMTFIKLANADDCYTFCNIEVV